VDLPGRSDSKVVLISLMAVRISDEWVGCITDPAETSDDCNSSAVDGRFTGDRVTGVKCESPRSPTDSETCCVIWESSCERPVPLLEIFVAVPESTSEDSDWSERVWSERVWSCDDPVCVVPPGSVEDLVTD